MSRSIMSCAWVLSCVACASAVPGERGLATLRVQLGQGVPVGVVVADRLVHRASGLTIARLPGEPWNAAELGGAPILFEGEPGVAMFFDGPQRSLARVRHGELERVVLYPPDAPRTVPVVAASASVSNGAFTDKVEEVALQVPTQGVSAMFGAATFNVRRGGADVFVAEPDANLVKACIATVTGSLARAATTDGVLYHYERSAKYRIPDTACTDEIRGQGLDGYEDGSQRFERNETYWLLFPANGGAPRVIESELVFIEDFGTTTTYHSEIALSGGHLAFDSTGEAMRIGGSDAWQWTLVRDDGTTYDLAASDD